MAPVITPDLGQNILVTIYLLFTHNYIAFAYFLGMLIGIGLSLYRPSRFATMILLGFATLLFSYEYDKHIIEAFRQQTLKSLITLKPHYRVQQFINLVITEILPVLFYISGWIFIYTAIIFEALSKAKKNENRK